MKKNIAATSETGATDLLKQKNEAIFNETGETGATDISEHFSEAKKTATGATGATCIFGKLFRSKNRPKTGLRRGETGATGISIELRIGYPSTKVCQKAVSPVSLVFSMTYARLMPVSPRLL